MGRDSNFLNPPSVRMVNATPNRNRLSVFAAYTLDVFTAHVRCAQFFACWFPGLGKIYSTDSQKIRWKDGTSATEETIRR